MKKFILPNIPEHNIYVEAFFGGGAIYWAKEPSKVEVINDVNMNVINFYEVLKHQYFDLRKLVEATLYSRDTHKRAKIIYDAPWLFADNPTVRAWAFFVVTNQGFGARIGSWGYDKSKAARAFQNKIDRFQETLSERLRYTQIEANKADKVILSRDTEETFVYADPPYINSDQGHYGGYSEDDFRRDLDALSKIKGKFLLSTYPSDVLDEYIEKHGWYSKSIEMVRDSGNNAKRSTVPRKTEVLTANYPID